MEVPSYTSNIQSYSSQSGTKIANDYDSTQNVSPQSGTSRASELNQQSVHSLEKAVEFSPQQVEIDRNERKRIVEEMNEFISSFNKDLSFRVDEESGREVVTIYEASTGEIIRQIPDEEMLEILRRLREQTSRYSSGLFDGKV